jgi:ribosomal protein L19
MAAFRDKNNKYAMIYLPVGKKIAVNTSIIEGDSIRVSWFDPRIGKTENAGQVKKETIMNFVSPTEGVENDWVLIIEKN